MKNIFDYVSEKDLKNLITAIKSDKNILHIMGIIGTMPNEYFHDMNLFLQFLKSNTNLDWKLGKTLLTKDNKTFYIISGNIINITHIGVSELPPILIQGNKLHDIVNCLNQDSFESLLNFA